MAIGFLSIPLLLLSFYIYWQLYSNDPEGRVTNAKVSDPNMEDYVQIWRVESA